jgi:hypothetical protein
MATDKRRRAMWVVVIAVACFAAVQSFSHIYWLGHTHGQDRLDSCLLPLSVDGLILACTLALGYAGWLAYFGLWLGVAATVAANASFGWAHGPLGVASSTWPALSFIVAVHVAMRAIKRPVNDGGKSLPPRGEFLPPGSTTPGAVPSSTLAAAETSLRATVAAGNPWSANQLQTQFSLTRTQATKLRSEVLAETDGHGDLA